MKLPKNLFKEALRDDRRQLGLWVGLADPYVAEVLATAGFDWLLLDAEHAPNDPRSILPQLQALAAYPVSAVVRPVCGDIALIKQYLDIGAQTLLIPMVETADHAMQLVAATRYPPRGVRGVGSALARASRWNRIENYLGRCEEQISLLVQVESEEGLRNLAAIARIEGIDGVFFGPADLSASMGLIGQSGHPRVREAISAGIQIVRNAGKAPGVLSADRAMAHHYLTIGARFVAVGVDTAVLVDAASSLAAAFKHQFAE
jgi:4-hydroxy-2-oxoheptanedioate aldolase